jgi:hypothetical protein
MKRLITILLTLVFLPAILLAGITILICDGLNWWLDQMSALGNWRSR